MIDMQRGEFFFALSKTGQYEQIDMYKLVRLWQLTALICSVHAAF